MEKIIALLILLVSQAAHALDQLSDRDLAAFSGSQGLNEYVIDKIINESLDQLDNPQTAIDIVDINAGFSTVFTYETEIEGYTTDLIHNPTGMDRMVVHFDRYALLNIRTSANAPSMGNIEFRNVDIDMSYNIQDLDLNLTGQ